MDPRQDALRGWLGAVLDGAPFELSVASADASFRRYFRVHLNDVRTPSMGAGVRSLIAMDAPPAHEDVQTWFDVQRRIERAGVHAPQVHMQDLAQGFLLIADLGDTTYQTALEQGADPAPLYQAALAALARMQGRIRIDGLPPYDRAKLHFELELFRDWLCGRHLGLTLTPAEQQLLDRAFAFLEDAALAMPVAFVHRDYHARNLMRSDPNPGVLDFQDALAGPVAYDLVSLTRDAYLSWPAATIDAWIAEFHAQARAEGAPLPASLAEFTLQHDLIGLQRHLKVAGIFCRLAHRDGKRGYLADVPRVLGYLQEVLPRHAALADLERFVRARVAPAFEAAA